MHHTHSALHRPRAANRRRAQAQPAFKGYGFADHLGRLKAPHTTAAVGIAVSPCMPGPCWVGVSRSSRTGSEAPTGLPPDHDRKPRLGRNRLRPPQSCQAVPSLADANRRREGLAPQQIRQGTRLKAYQQHPCAPARHEEEEWLSHRLPSDGSVMLLVRMQGQRTHGFSSRVLFPYTYLFVRLSASTEREPSPSYTAMLQQKKFALIASPSSLGHPQGLICRSRPSHGLPACPRNALGCRSGAMTIRLT